MKKVIIIIIVLLILSTLPAVIQNQKRADIAIEELKEILDEFKKVCDSGCTDYPEEWVMAGFEPEPERFCRLNCMDNMNGIREVLLTEYFPDLYIDINEYNHRVSQLYCALRIVCPQLQVIEFIKNYNSR